MAKPNKTAKADAVPVASVAAAEAAQILPTDAAQLAKLFADMRAEMKAQFDEQLAAAIKALRPDIIQAVAVDMQKLFADNAPGIDGPDVTEDHAIPEAADAAKTVGVPELRAGLLYVHRKLDALIQATNQGGAQALAKFL